MIPDAHWERLASLEAADVSRRTGATYDPANGRYLLPLLDRHVVVDPAARSVRWHDEHRHEDDGPRPNAAFFSVAYLAEAGETRPAADWVTAESLRSGAFFFRGPHALPTTAVAERFDQDAHEFLKAGQKLGGRPVDWGDAGVEIQVVPRIAVRLVLWLGDEEFSSRVTMLFQRRTEEHIPVDLIFSMAQHVVSSLLRAAADGQ